MVVRDVVLFDTTAAGKTMIQIRDSVERRVGRPLVTLEQTQVYCPGDLRRKMDCRHQEAVMGVTLLLLSVTVPSQTVLLRCQLYLAQGEGDVDMEGGVTCLLPNKEDGCSN